MIGVIVGVVVAAVAVTLIVLTHREQREAIHDLGAALLTSQRHHAASSAAVRIAEEHTARALAVLAALRKQIDELAKLDVDGNEFIVGEAIQKLKGDAEAACFAAGSIPPKEKR